MEPKTIIVVFVIGFVAGLGTYKIFHNDPTNTIPVQETKRNDEHSYFGHRYDLELYNDSVYQTKEFQDIKEAAMNDVYLTYATRRIEQLSSSEDERDIEKVAKAKALIKEKKYSELVGCIGQFGCCHDIWGLKKRILREKYNIIWYSPSEINPNITYD